MNITIDSNETAHFTLGDDKFEAYAVSWTSMNAEFVLRVIKNGEHCSDGVKAQISEEFEMTKKHGGNPGEDAI